MVKGMSIDETVISWDMYVHVDKLVPKLVRVRVKYKMNNRSVLTRQHVLKFC